MNSSAVACDVARVDIRDGSSNKRQVEPEDWESQEPANDDTEQSVSQYLASIGVPNATTDADVSILLGDLNHLKIDSGTDETKSVFDDMPILIEGINQLKPDSGNQAKDEEVKSTAGDDMPMLENGINQLKPDSGAHDKDEEVKSTAGDDSMIDEPIKNGDNANDEDDDEATMPLQGDLRQPKFKIPAKTSLVIFISRALSAWGDRLWAFGIGILMNVLGPENLRLVALYGFSTSVSVIFFGASIGAWIDKTDRLWAAKCFLAVQNLVTALCCSALAIFFASGAEQHWPEVLISGLPYTVIVMAILANLASLGSKISVEKDWVVVIANGDKEFLSKMNSTLRTIDLLCLLVAPLLAGVVFDQAGNAGAAVFIAIWNVVSVIFEYLLLVEIYKEFPALAQKVRKRTKIDQLELEDEAVTKPPNGTTDDARKKSQAHRLFGSLGQSVMTTFQPWTSYMRHNIRNAGLGLALLYMTVLGFDNITYGYCMKQCVPESILGALVGVSAVFGVLGSVAFPILLKRIGLTKTGLTGFGCLVSTLILCVVAVGLDGSPFRPELLFTAVPEVNATLGHSVPHGQEQDGGCKVDSFVSVAMFLSGVISARFGLWIADLTVNQILQQEVAGTELGSINGVQSGLNSLLNTVKFVLVILLPEVETFGYLIVLSFISVSAGAVFYSVHAANNISKKNISKNSLNPEADQVP